MPIRIRGLDYNDATEKELAAHGLDPDDALDVYDGPAKYFPQDAKDRLDDGERLYRQPDRILMIGPDASGRLLTFVLELPDADRISPCRDRLSLRAEGPSPLPSTRRKDAALMPVHVGTDLEPDTPELDVVSGEAGAGHPSGGVHAGRAGAPAAQRSVEGRGWRGL